MSKKIIRIISRSALALALPLLLLFFFAFMIKTTAEYACVLQVVRQDPQVVAALGAPIQPGLFAWTPYFESGGQVRQGAFVTAVSGPRGRGKIKANFYRTPVGATMAIDFCSQGKEITLYDGPYICPD